MPGLSHSCEGVLLKRQLEVTGKVPVRRKRILKTRVVLYKDLDIYIES